MSDEIETIDKNPQSWAAWKREAERLQGIIDGMALAAMDSEPVQMFGIGSIFKPQRVIEQEADCDDCAHYNPKTCHGEGCPAISQQSAQPAPVVPDIDELRLAFEAADRESDDGFNLHKYGIGYADDETQGRWNTWLACRAAMLNGGKS